MTETMGGAEGDAVEDLSAGDAAGLWRGLSHPWDDAWGAGGHCSGLSGGLYSHLQEGGSR